MLEAHVIELLEQVFEKMDLSLVSGGKVCMPSFGAVSKITRFIPCKKGLAQAGTRRNHGDGPPANSLATINGVDVTGP